MPIGVDPEAAMDEWDEALRAGQPVIVSAVRLFAAVHDAGLDWRPYAYGGEHFGKSFVLNANDGLTEYIEE
jgi:hypothetical protein